MNILEAEVSFEQFLLIQVKAFQPLSNVNPPFNYYANTFKFTTTDSLATLRSHKLMIQSFTMLQHKLSKGLASDVGENRTVPSQQEKDSGMDFTVLFF